MHEVGIPAYDQGDYDWVIGTDEAGYGCWAGDLVVGMAAVRKGWQPSVPIGDSKKLTPAARDRAYEALLKDLFIFQQVHSVSPAAVDRDGVYRTLIMTHEAAVKKAHQAIVAKYGDKTRIVVIVDGNMPIKNAVSLPKADNLIPACSAASILAKVWRDREMVKLAKVYPGYGFERHMGYGTPEHQRALGRLGVCGIHRLSYAPIAKCAEKEVEHRGLWDEFCDDETV